jgi:hypothetical protein
VCTNFIFRLKWPDITGTSHEDSPTLMSFSLFNGYSVQCEVTPEAEEGVDDLLITTEPVSSATCGLKPKNQLIIFAGSPINGRYGRHLAIY